MSHAAASHTATSHASTGPLAGRLIAITGGARGIGLALGLAAARAGARVALLDRLDTVGASARRLTEETGADCLGVEVDVTDPASVEQAFDQVEGALGPADGLVNAAGITLGTPALDIGLEDWNRILAVNVTGTLLTCQAFARRHIARESGREAAVVNVSSMSAFAVNVPQTQAAYNTSKAAVSMLTRSLAVEWLPLGVRVNAIAPGYIASDMTRDFVAQNPEMAEDWVSRIPAGRMGTPEELGDLVVYLLGPGSAYMVGQSLVIDGGYTLV
ncbi:SDR family NAD(P)-dependent oxidoreductase [Zhihengliuella alba]|uniref:SDR family NAD(P)-dependent oxidoreductase n=2 Tax=Zhihengliuella alba TaxID=547018 RepID=A0ABP7E164_9MICC